MARRAMRHSVALRQADRQAVWGDGPWAVRLRFCAIALTLVSVSWVTVRSLHGAVSFDWTARLPALPAPLTLSAVENPGATPAARRIPTIAPTSSAQAVPTSTRVPPLVAVVPRPTPTLTVAPFVVETAPTPHARATGSGRATVTPSVGVRKTPAGVATPTPQRSGVATPTPRYDGVTRPASRSPITPRPTPGSGSIRIYLVQQGDTLTAIARRESVSVAVIATANHLAPPYPLKPGMVLHIPVAANAAG